MGVLRLLLALSVVAGHSKTFVRTFFLINAKAAVVGFFVISGFYMALVLKEKYTSKIEFLANRWLRIYVPYIVVTVISATYFWPRARRPLGVLFDITLVGQDIAGGLQWVDRGTFVLPQAWSLSMEITYYLAAALLFTLPYGITIAFLGGYALHLVLWQLDFVSVMSSPSMFVFFALGGVVYFVYVKIKPWPQIVKLCLALAGLLVVGEYLRSIYPAERLRLLGQDTSISDGTQARFIILYVMIAALVPFLFAATRNITIDRLIGEISYPVYLIHFVIVDLARRLDFRFGRIDVYTESNPYRYAGRSDPDLPAGRSPPRRMACAAGEKLGFVASASQRNGGYSASGRVLKSHPRIAVFHGPRSAYERHAARDPVASPP